MCFFYLKIIVNFVGEANNEVRLIEWKIHYFECVANLMSLHIKLTQQIRLLVVKRPVNKHSAFNQIIVAVFALLNKKKKLKPKKSASQRLNQDSNKRSCLAKAWAKLFLSTIRLHCCPELLNKNPNELQCCSLTAVKTGAAASKHFPLKPFWYDHWK